MPIPKARTEATMMFGCLATYLETQCGVAARPWEVVVNVNDIVSREDELIDHVLHFLRQLEEGRCSIICSTVTLDVSSLNRNV